MFDKILCKRIHKKEITISDLAEYLTVKFGEYVFPILVLIGLGVLAFVMTSPFTAPIGELFNNLIYDLTGYAIYTVTDARFCNDIPTSITTSQSICITDILKYAAIGDVCVVGVLFAFVVGVTILIEIFRRIGKVKIATCPLQKPADETTEPESSYPEV